MGRSQTGHFRAKSTPKLQHMAMWMRKQKYSFREIRIALLELHPELAPLDISTVFAWVHGRVISKRREAEKKFQARVENAKKHRRTFCRWDRGQALHILEDIATQIHHLIDVLKS